MGAALLLAGCGSAAGAPSATADLPAPRATVLPTATSPPNVAFQAATPAFATVAAVQPLAESHMQRLRADLDHGDFAGVARDSQAVSADLQRIADAQAILDDAISRQQTAVPDSATPPPLVSPVFLQESQDLAEAAAATVAAHQAEATASARPRSPVPASPTPAPARVAPAPTATRPPRAPAAPARPLPPTPTPVAPSPVPATATPTERPTAVEAMATGTLAPVIDLPVGIAPVPRIVKPDQTLVVHAASFAQAFCHLDAEMPGRATLPVSNADKQADAKGAITWWWPVPETASGALVTLTVQCQKGNAAGQHGVTIQVE